MWICPVPQCGMKFRNALQISMHLRKNHKLSRGQTRMLEALPPLVELLENHTYRYPGVDRPTELEAPALPSGALAHNMKDTLRRDVQAVLGAGPSSCSTSAASRSTSEVQRPPQPVTKNSVQPIPPAPAMPPATYDWLFQTPPPPPPLPVTMEEIQAIPMPPGPAQPAFPASQPTTMDATNLASSSGSSASVPEKTERRVVLRELQSIGPAIQRPSQTQTSSNGNAPSSQMHRAEVRNLDTTIEQLMCQRREATENAFNQIKREYERKAKECQAPKQHLAYVESELQGYQRNEQYVRRPTRVGHLQTIGSTRTHLLMPNLGHTAVFPLTARISWSSTWRTRTKRLVVIPCNHHFCNIGWKVFYWNCFSLNFCISA